MLQMLLNFFSLSLTLRQNKLECQSLIFINFESDQCLPYKVSSCLTHNYQFSMKNVPRTNTLAYLAAALGPRIKVFKVLQNYFLGHSCMGKISQSVCPSYVFSLVKHLQARLTLPEWSSILREGTGLAHNYQTSLKETFGQTLQLILSIRQ